MRRDGGDLQVLGEEDCRNLLAAAHVGRVVVSMDAMPAAFPVNYVLVGREVYFRTSTGTKLSAAVNGTVVAFQVDRIDSLGSEGWSVLVIGRARLVTDPAEQALLDRVGLTSWAAPADAGYVAIGTDRVTGRRLWQARHDIEPAATAEFSAKEQ
jgi:nitroimidazol reductase NimA-like FMN-containing flavoprotein (pyridoxamine 5'-phosphate oxidase superfamily)